MDILLSVLGYLIAPENVAFAVTGASALANILPNEPKTRWGRFLVAFINGLAGNFNVLGLRMKAERVE